MITAPASAVALREFQQDAEMLARAEELLAASLRAEEPAERFELAHRSALRAAGVLVQRANRERRRRLPVNVWTALRRLGTDGERIADAFAPMVALRERQIPGARALLPQPLLERQRRLAQDLLEEVRETLLDGLEAPALAS